MSSNTLCCGLLEIVLDRDKLEIFQNASTASHSSTLSGSQEEEEVVKQGWTLVQNKIEWKEWVHLYEEVHSEMHVVHVDSNYVSQTVSCLSQEEVDEAFQVLMREGLIKSSSNVSALRLAQVLQELYPPLSYGILANPPFTLRHHCRHSCLPNVALNVTNDMSLQWIALYDLDEDEEQTVSYVDASSPLHERKAALLDRFGSSFVCNCVKCTGNPTTVRDAQRLGHAAFQEGRYNQARTWYEHSLKMSKDLQSDIWHALGAISLQQGHFVEAQRFWKQAVDKHPALAQHEGIALQLEKQTAYGYFKNDKRTVVASLPPYQDYFSGLCFVTDDMVSEAACRQIIAWAEAHEWTKSRHYAVPTNDVPVHKVPPLLTWFVEWMNKSVSPLLASQFHVEPTFYVHDAFVVRYEACQKHNHLPLHYDESTHSFVLALNDDFEGGGTYFYEHDIILNPLRGSLVSFRGNKLRHGGNLVTKGIRYILAVFLYHDCGRKRSLPEALDTSKKSKGFAFDFDVDS